MSCCTKPPAPDESISNCVISAPLSASPLSNPLDSAPLVPASESLILHRCHATNDLISPPEPSPHPRAHSQRESLSDHGSKEARPAQSSRRNRHSPGRWRQQHSFPRPLWDSLRIPCAHNSLTAFLISFEFVPSAELRGPAPRTLNRAAQEGPQRSAPYCGAPLPRLFFEDGCVPPSDDGRRPPVSFPSALGVHDSSTPGSAFDVPAATAARRRTRGFSRVATRNRAGDVLAIASSGTRPAVHFKTRPNSRRITQSQLRYRMLASRATNIHTPCQLSIEQRS